MDFLSSLIAVALTYGFTEDEVVQIHSNYCQNLYWQPDALEKMKKYECDIEAVSQEITRVQEGRY